jgi:hypothetical protein
VVYLLRQIFRHLYLLTPEKLLHQLVDLAQGQFEYLLAT